MGQYFAIETQRLFGAKLSPMTRTLTMYQVDAFTDALFAGNPAAVLVLEEALDARSQTEGGVK